MDRFRPLVTPSSRVLHNNIIHHIINTLERKSSGERKFSRNVFPTYTRLVHYRFLLRERAFVSPAAIYHHAPYSTSVCMCIYYTQHAFENNPFLCGKQYDDARAVLSLSSSYQEVYTCPVPASVYSI